MTDRPSMETRLAEVLAHIAASGSEPVELGDLARIAGLSPYHFSRLFTARFGQSVIGYVRDCRLQAAALALLSDHPPSLVDAALDAGFGSQQAFTRAFRSRYGVSPGRFGRQGRAHKLEETMMTAHTDTTPVRRLDELVRRDAFTLAGVRILFDMETQAAIPAMWPRLIGALPLPGQVGEVTFGATWLIERVTGRYGYLAGVEVTGEGELPAGIERMAIPAQTYAVFRITFDGGPLQPQLKAAMPTIWGEMLPASGLTPVPAPDLEVYPHDFQPNRKGAYIDLHIPVEA